MKRGLLFVFLILFLVGSVSAADYYVAKTGCSDSYSGTEAQPWCTIQKAADTLVAGDTVYVKAGVYYANTITMKRSGTAFNPITFKNYNNDVVTVDGQNQGQWAVIDWGSLYDYIVWDGINVRDGSNHGIRVRGDHNIIRNSHIYDNGPSTQSGILLADGDYNIVSHNDVQNNHNGIMIADCNYALIEYNIVRNNTSHSGIDFLPDTSRDPQLMWVGNNASYNVVYGNNHGIYSRYQQYNQYDHNVIFSNVVQGIYFAPHPSMPPNVYPGYTNVYKNTIVGNGKNGIYDESTTYLTIKNNILAYNSNYDIYITSGRTAGHNFDYNLYYDSTLYGWAGTQSTLSAWQSASGQDAHSFEADPLFTDPANDDYSLQEDSPACGNGEGGSDIGAFDCSSSPTENCSQLSGLCCTTGQTCSEGNFQSASDCSLCCVGGTCQTPFTGLIITVDSNYSGYSTDPIDDDVVDPYGGTSTTWASANSAEPHWVQINFSEQKSINNVTVYWAYNNAREAFMEPQEFWVQYWDGAMYQNASIVTGSQGAELSSVTFPVVNTVSLRIYQPGGMGYVDYANVMWLTEIDYFYGLASSCSSGADGDYDSVVSISELLSFISSWKSGDIGISELLSGIGEWKSGC